jgi:hypothetical protein
MNQALLRGRAIEVDIIRKYLPSNYRAFTWGNDVIVHGEDVAGWTLNDYVIPRLASGGYHVSDLG